MALIFFKCHNVTSHISKQYFATNKGGQNNPITQLLTKFHFINTFHDKILYIFCFNRSDDLLNVAVITCLEHCYIPCKCLLLKLGLFQLLTVVHLIKI